MADTSEGAAAMADAEGGFRVAFQHAPIGMALVGVDGNLLQVNPALCRLLGYGEDELVGMTRQALTHPDDLARSNELARRLYRGHLASYELEKRYRHADGHYVWIHLSVSLVRDEHGKARHFVAQIQDISDRKQTQIELEYLADHDWLSGLLNRHGFQRRLERVVSRAEPGKANGALLLLDIDGFKYVNDTLGHHAGDRVITTIASILRSRLRETDLLGRLGGDEFAALLVDADAECAGRVAEEILHAIRVTPTIAEARAHRLTASAGIAMLDGIQPDGEAAIMQADLAMYAAKEGGRDRVCTWAEGDVQQRRLLERMTWVRRIEDALFHGGFELHAQPIMTLATGEVARHELLLRLRDGDGGLILPGEFLETAERFELIQQIDRWVAGEAIRTLAGGFGPGSLTVNLSGRSIGDDELLRLLARNADSIRGGPSRLTFEITETAAVADLDVARDFTHDLSRLGYGVALDDFGAGFGSFAYLKYLHFDLLKIDGDFVRGSPSNTTDRLIIEAVVGIARGLRKQTVAEFTETDRTIRCMARLGVDHCQGHGIGLPAPLHGALLIGSGSGR